MSAREHVVHQRTDGIDMDDDDIYRLLLEIAKKTENRNLQVELQKTATGIKQASVGGGLGGVVGAVAGGVMGGRDGAIVGAAVGAAAGSMAATMGQDFKPLLELMEGLSEDDRTKIAEKAREWAIRRGLQLAFNLVNTKAAQELLVEVVQVLGYTFKS